MTPRRVFVVPHPPELFSVPEKSDETFPHTTLAAYDDVCSRLSEDSPSSIIFLQMLGGIHPDGLTFHVPEKDVYTADYSEVKDSSPNHELQFDRLLSHQIQKSIHDYDQKTHVLEQSVLPYSVSLFLDRYRKHSSSLESILVLGLSLEGAKQQYAYGSLIARALSSDTQNNAVVAIGQLSHCLTKESEAGYVEGSDLYDADIQQYLENQTWDDLMNYDPFELERVGEDLYRPLCASLGVLDALENPTTWSTASYEAPRGIGYLVGEFQTLDR